MDLQILTTLLIVLLALMLARVWRAFRQASEQARLHDALLRVDTRVEEQARHAEATHARLEARSKAVEDRVQSLDKALRVRLVRENRSGGAGRRVARATAGAGRDRDSGREQSSAGSASLLCPSIGLQKKILG